MRSRDLIAAAAVVAALAMTALTPLLTLASSSSQQKNKNLWRNLGIAGAAVGVNGLIHHNGTETVLGAAGAAYSAHRYEVDRHSQSQARQARRDRAQAHYRDYHQTYVRNGNKYYWYDGSQYYENLNTGRRHRVQ